MNGFMNQTAGGLIVHNVYPLTKFSGLFKSGGKQGDDGSVVHGLGDGKGSGAIASDDAKVCIRCKKSSDNLDVALLGCQ